MPKKQKIIEEVLEEQVPHILIQDTLQSGDREFRMGVLAMAKEILERNAALQWEQDKTRGLSVTAEEIIEEAKKLMEFINVEI